MEVPHHLASLEALLGMSQPRGITSDPIVRKSYEQLIAQQRQRPSTNPALGLNIVGTMYPIRSGAPTGHQALRPD